MRIIITGGRNREVYANDAQIRAEAERQNIAYKENENE
jgi:hypothetical protein